MNKKYTFYDMVGHKVIDSNTGYGAVVVTDNYLQFSRYSDFLTAPEIGDTVIGCKVLGDRVKVYFHSGMIINVRKDTEVIFSEAAYKKATETYIGLGFTALWERYEVELIKDCIHDKSCKHSYKDRYGHTITPRVIVAYNEGNYASTGVCYDCLVENVEKKI